eukprot:UN03738
MSSQDDLINQTGLFVLFVVFSMSIGSLLLLLFCWVKKFCKAGSKPQCIFILGPPGAGKGTQSSLIAKNHPNVKHYSVGDLLRNAQVNHIHSSEIEKHIKGNTIVPVQITMGILKEAMQKDVDTKKITRFLIDGFPRNQDNLDGWNKYMSDYVDLKGVIFLNVNDNVAKRRVLSRMRDENDKEKILEQRIKDRRKRALPVIEYYQHLNLLYKIDANQDVNAVYQKVDLFCRKLLKTNPTLF